MRCPDPNDSGLLVLGEERRSDLDGVSDFEDWLCDDIDAVLFFLLLHAPLLFLLLHGLLVRILAVERVDGALLDIFLVQLAVVATIFNTVVVVLTHYNYKSKSPRRTTFIVYVHSMLLIGFVLLDCFHFYVIGTFFP